MMCKKNSEKLRAAARVAYCCTTDLSIEAGSIFIPTPGLKTNTATSPITKATMVSA